MRDKYTKNKVRELKVKFIRLLREKESHTSPLRFQQLSPRTQKRVGVLSETKKQTRFSESFRATNQIEHFHCQTEGSKSNGLQSRMMLVSTQERARTCSVSL
jgi:hypothetical protein